MNFIKNLRFAYLFLKNADQIKYQILEKQYYES